MTRIIEALFEFVGLIVMAAIVTYASFYVVGETVEHFTP